MDSKFHIGDRVYAKSSPERIGTVIMIVGEWKIGVVHDAYMKGHDLSHHCPDGYGWWYRDRDLELSEEPPLDVKFDLTGLL